MRWQIRTVIAGLVCVAPAGVVRAGPITFVNDYEGFLAAAGEVQTIDFETLPDGSPSYDHALITPEFNYTDQGVTFESAFPELLILGYMEFGLYAFNPDSSARNWLIADFSTPVTAVGVFFPGNTTLSAFDVDENLIAEVSYGSSGHGFFVGIVSPDVPISFGIGDRGAHFQGWESVTYAPILEPSSFVLLTLSSLAFLCRQRRNR